MLSYFYKKSKMALLSRQSGSPSSIRAVSSAVVEHVNYRGGKVNAGS